MKTRPAYDVSGEFGKHLLDVSAIARQFGFIVPVKLSPAVETYLTEQGIRLDRFLKHLYRVYPDDESSVCLRVKDRRILAFTCLETQANLLEICIVFETEEGNVFKT